MKKLPDRDTTISGYVSIFTALGILVVSNLTGDLGSFSPFVALGLGMLGVALLADRSDSKFVERNPWLIRLINAPMWIAPLSYLAIQYWDREFDVFAVVFGLIPVLIFIPLYKKYYRENAIDVSLDADLKR